MSDTMSPDGPDAGPGPGPTQPSPPGGGGPPPVAGGGGPSPVLAALARARMQAQPSQPGQGTQGGALQKIAMAVELLQSALPALPNGSHHRRSVLTALTHLDRMGGREVPMGAQQTGIQDLLRAHAQNAMMQRLMQQRGGQAGPPGGGGGPVGPPPGMQPSTPMPGA